MMDILEFSPFKKYNLVVFDLDDTLYPERDYLFAAYDSIAQLVSERVGGNSLIYSDFLKKTFIDVGRSNLFDSFINEFNLSNTVNINELLSILRTNECHLFLYKKAISLLDYLQNENISITIFTNGNLIQQRNKVRCLHLKEVFPAIEVYYAAEYEPKPSPLGLNIIISDYKVSTNSTLLIGDSVTDYEAARAAGVDYLNSSYITH